MTLMSWSLPPLGSYVASARARSHAGALGCGTKRLNVFGAEQQGGPSEPVKLMGAVATPRVMLRRIRTRTCP
jgi:hypothetical protein